MDNDDIYNRTVLPLVLRLKLAQPFNRFPFSGAGRVSSELQRFRSNHLIDGHIYGEQEDPHGTIVHFIRIVDTLGQEVTYHNDRATAQAGELSQLRADVGAMRRLMGVSSDLEREAKLDA